MITKLRLSLLLLAVALLLPVRGAVADDAAAAKLGLLVIAHGSPSATWNQPVLDLGPQIARRASETGKVLATRIALMEFSEPSVPTAVAELETAGCSRIIAVPLFVMPTGHTHFDVPAILGLYSSKETDGHAEEHGGIARCGIPVTLTETMSGDERLLLDYALSQAKNLSDSPADEAIVFLAHGAPSHELLCERVMRKIAAFCCSKTGIDYADWAYVGVGQQFKSEGLSAIGRARKTKDRVLVIGLYLASNAQRIHDRAMGTDSNSHIHGGGEASNRGVVFSNEGIVTSPFIVDWVIESASAAADAFQE